MTRKEMDDDDEEEDIEEDGTHTDVYVPSKCSDKRINCRIGNLLEDKESGERFKIFQVVKIQDTDELYYQYYDVDKNQRRPRISSKFEYTPCEEMLVEEDTEGAWVRWLQKPNSNINAVVGSKRKIAKTIEKSSPSPASSLSTHAPFNALPKHVLLSTRAEVLQEADSAEASPSSSSGPSHFVHVLGDPTPQRSFVWSLTTAPRQLKVRLNQFSALVSEVSEDVDKDDSELFSFLANYYRDLHPLCQAIYNIAICMKLEFGRCHDAFVSVANTWEAFKRIRLRNGYLDNEYVRNVLYGRDAIHGMQLVTRSEYPLDFSDRAPTAIGAELYCHFLYIAASWPTVSDELLARYMKTVYDFDMLEHVGCGDIPQWIERECLGRVGFDKVLARIIEFVDNKRELLESLPNLKDDSIRPSKAGRPTPTSTYTKFTVDVPIVDISKQILEIPGSQELSQLEHRQLKNVNGLQKLERSLVPLQDNGIYDEESTHLKIDFLHQRVICFHEFGRGENYVAKATAAFMKQHKVISAATEKTFKLKQ